jgi:hypothetical protein
MDDQAVSTYAHNIKTISQNGVVTLKGPVNSADEKRPVVAKAVAMTGSADRTLGCWRADTSWKKGMSKR